MFLYENQVWSGGAGPCCPLSPTLKQAPLRELYQMNSYRIKLISIMLVLFVAIEYRLFDVATTTDNWQGLAITTTHLAIVGAGAYWGLVRAQSD